MATAYEAHVSRILKIALSRDVGKPELDVLVTSALNDEKLPSGSTEARRNRWEYSLRKPLLELAASEALALEDPQTRYYDDMKGILELALTFNEHDACDPSFTIGLLQELFETQTVQSCSRIFSWVEARRERLCLGMVPSKGKSLPLLRSLNDLLRRVSKTGDMTVFCGRILTFLSVVFPLSERSGVNLRGEYGPAWEDVKKPAVTAVAVPSDSGIDDTKIGSNQMDVDADAKEASTGPKSTVSSDDFYYTFWSLQLPFSKPSAFTSPTALSEFKDAVGKVLPIIREATAKERLMMGKSQQNSSGSNKRKREAEVSDMQQMDAYFFAKYVTKPELLELEVADVYFRRQFLVQLLILLHHLKTFTKASKEKWETPKNRSLQMDFVLDETDSAWVQETIHNVYNELEQTQPGGRTFVGTVRAVLEREQNWVRWKNEMCFVFELPPWSVDSAAGEGRKVGMEEATAEARRTWLTEKLNDLPEQGTRTLTEIWADGYNNDMWSLETMFSPASIKQYVKKLRLEDLQIANRKKLLAARMPKPKPKPREPSPPPVAIAPPPTAALSIADSNTAKTEPPAEGADNMAIDSATPAPIHPSLPAKPNADSPSGASSQNADAPTTATAAAASLPSSSTVAVPTATPAPATGTPTPKPAAPGEIGTRPATPAVVVDPFATDPKIMELEANKMKWTWLSLRAEREFHLQHYGKIGLGDLDQLEKEIEQQKVEEAAAAAHAKAKEKEKEDRLAAGANDDNSGKVDEAITTATAFDTTASEETTTTTTQPVEQQQQQQQQQQPANLASQETKMEE